VAFLQASSLFLDLHADELALLAELCQPIAFESGQIVFHEQDSGDCLYIIEEGEVEVIHGPAEPGAEVCVIATMGRGEFFGEMSMLEKSTRSATVRACTRLTLLMLSTDDFYSFAKIFKNGFTVVIINIARILSQRLRQTTGRLKGM
jgi:CRP-like cAMP-binding protein